MLYDVNEFEPNMRAMADRVIMLAKLTAEALPLLRNIAQNGSKLHTLTAKSPRSRNSPTSSMTKAALAVQGPGEKGSARLHRRSELYEHLEKVCDRFEDVAHVKSDYRHRTRLIADAHPWNPVSSPLTIVFLIAVALLFDLINGMHDAANSIATVVSTRVLKPFHAVLWAAFFNFAAYFLFEAPCGQHHRQGPHLAGPLWTTRWSSAHSSGPSPGT